MMKTFNYKKYKNCYFKVGRYLYGDNAMAISIENETNGPITTCTVIHELGMYMENITTIKNYSENANITNFLKSLGIVVNVIGSYPCNAYVKNTTETIDICEIDMEKLKEYTKE